MSTPFANEKMNTIFSATKETPVKEVPFFSSLVGAHSKLVSENALRKLIDDKKKSLIFIEKKDVVVPPV
eukprot:TRINITY_DN82944_c0_g1_i2.p1 TRINITY_DN82944_c0_g1~~TRINITY_DN82944_c0_g1_i2.p1  ORF type:complete len:69 (+),score=13.20 TRINITY_DN82944_c0_g1_i2:52-258(+)